VLLDVVFYAATAFV